MCATLPLSLANSYPPSVRLDHTAYENYKARFLAQDPICFALMNRALLALDIASVLQHIRCPTLVLAGEHDLVRPPQEVAAFARRIPGAQFALLNSGHLMSVQAPEQLLVALNNFVTVSKAEPMPYGKLIKENS
jgi:3-oxoadipate enol-lactonase